MYGCIEIIFDYQSLLLKIYFFVLSDSGHLASTYFMYVMISEYALAILLTLSFMSLSV